MASATDTAKLESAGDITPAKSNTLTMQIILRRDLVESLNWPIGPLMAQAAHAATAVLTKYRESDERVRRYEGDVGNMRKAVLEIADEESIRALADALDKAEPPIGHYLWMEQPENYPTALAIVPNEREKRLKKILDKHGVKLWK